MIIAIGSDHAGFELKKIVIEHLKSLGHQVIDSGCESDSSANYALFSINCASIVSSGNAEFGIVCCGSGIGASIAANKVLNIRCALCGDVESAIITRKHNNSNVLALAGRNGNYPGALKIVDAFLETTFEAGRHQERINFISNYERSNLKNEIIGGYIEEERVRQNNHLELIASENYVSKDVLIAAGSILTNKYAEGYPGKRYYGGCAEVDKIESYAIEKLKKLFDAEHANVQPHSGSQANEAVYLATLNVGDTVLGMDLNSGGHLTHGHKLNFSGIRYNFVSYFVDEQTQLINYDKVREIAHRVKPKLIVAGASSYSRIIDFAAFRQIADEVGAYLMVDMAHIAGLVAAKLHPSPIPHAHFVTTTTHKTLRGPRGGAILCKKEFAASIDRAVFPGTQGGPLMHIIAAKGICFEEALQKEFIDYQLQIVKNAQMMANTFINEGFKVVSGGTDNHLLSVDVKTKTGLTGKEAETLLDSINITVNKNTIPYDNEPPNKASGIRLGSPALTTRGLIENDFEAITKIICKALLNSKDEDIISECKEEVKKIINKYPF